MFEFTKKKNTIENKLYNKILSLSRNKLFYTKMSVNDTFQNRIHLIFLHVSFLFIKIKNQEENKLFKKLHQNIFDLIFKQIEINMREIGYGDATVNKNMKFLLKNFYNILLYCEEFYQKKTIEKKTFLIKYLVLNNKKPNETNNDLIRYFDKYQSFCFYLTLDSVLKGNFNFNYK